jgi:hypothetical protein
MNRRFLLTGASALALAACNKTTYTLTTGDIATVSDFVSGAQAAWNLVIKDFPNAASASIQAIVNSAFTAAQGLLNDLTVGGTGFVPATNLKGIVADIQAVANLVAPILPVAGAPQAIVDAFTAIETVASVVIPPIISALDPTAAGATLAPVPAIFSAPMSPALAQARLSVLAHEL